MCGIAGFVNHRNGLELVRKANACQSHRGPDHQGEWLHENVALAHQRLSIIDLNERSNQPFVKEGLVIVFNGEIYNYKEIKTRLEKECGASFVTSGDTEVVLEAYRYWGADSLQLFIGMFAYGIYSVAEKKMFLVRDHFGIKPLFYFRSGNQFSFSSELKTLLTAPGIKREINPFSLLTSLNYLWVSGHESMFQGCEKLKPGHYLEIHCASEALRVESKRYWEPSPELKDRPEEEWCELLNVQLQATIDRHIVGDVPVSSFLSGGLD